MSNILLILMGVFWLVGSIVGKQYFLLLAFIAYGLVFGLIEFVAKYYTGQTISQQVLALVHLHDARGIILLVCMFFGWVCLLLHLGMRFE